MGTLDCSPLAGLGPGQAAWTTTVPLVGGQSRSALGVGATGHAFLATGWRYAGSGDEPTGIQIDEVDGAGVQLGSLSSFGTFFAQNVPSATLAVSGARHYVTNARWSTWGIGGAMYTAVASDAGDTVVQGMTFGPVSAPYRDVRASGNAAGDRILVYQGSGMPGLLERVDASGTTVYSKTMPESPAFSGGSCDDAGAAYISGSAQGGVDVGCGPIAGNDGYVAKIDPAGQCVWSRGAGSLGAVTPVGAGAYLTGMFSGSLDLGCGAMSSGSGAQSYVAEIDGTGACVWSKSVAALNVGVSILASGGTLLTGNVAATADVGCGPAGPGALVAKLGPGGACVWQRMLVATYLSPAALPSGDVALTASFTGTIDLGTGPLVGQGVSDLAVARLDGSTGATVWSARFGGAGATLYGGPFADVGDGLLITGTFQGTVDFGAGPQSSDEKIPCLSDDDCAPDAAVCNAWPGFCSNFVTTYRSYALKLDAAGAFRWERSPGMAALDGCGATFFAGRCNECTGTSQPGLVVQRLAP